MCDVTQREEATRPAAVAGRPGEVWRGSQQPQEGPGQPWVVPLLRQMGTDSKEDSKDGQVMQNKVHEEPVCLAWSG